MSEKQIWIIEDDGNRLVKFREVQQCWKSTSGQYVPIHLCRKVAESNLYRYTTNLYQYTCVKTAGIEQEFDPNARACSSFNYQCGITMKRGIKSHRIQGEGSFLLLGLGFHKGCVLFHN